MMVNCEFTFPTQYLWKLFHFMKSGEGATLLSSVVAVCTMLFYIRRGALPYGKTIANALLALIFVSFIIVAAQAGIFSNIPAQARNCVQKLLNEEVPEVSAMSEVRVQELTGFVSAPVAPVEPESSDSSFSAPRKANTLRTHKSVPRLRPVKRKSQRRKQRARSDYWTEGSNYCAQCH